jgi:hypothetical protein
VGFDPRKAGGIAFDRIDRIALLCSEVSSARLGRGAEAVSKRSCLSMDCRGRRPHESAKDGCVQGKRTKMAESGGCRERHEESFQALSMAHPLIDGLKSHRRTAKRIDSSGSLNLAYGSEISE